jgi:3',5'-cyclic AMP phosphodiesterase CpdA
MLIAQISDLHIRPQGALAYGIVETNVYLERAVFALLRLDPRPDCVLVTGDLTDCGLAEEYALARQLLGRLPMPVYVIPGNHDRREPCRQAFLGDGYMPQDGALNYVAQCGPVRLVALDSVVAGAGHGALAAETLAFLEQALAADRSAPTLVMLHHPPFATGIRHMDAVRLLEGGDELARIVASHPQAQRLLCGHVHRSIQTLFGGAICQAAPSVAHQVTFDLGEASPSCFMLEPPGFLVHSLIDGTFVSHTVCVDRYAGPYPFVLPEDYPGRSQSGNPAA